MQPANIMDGRLALSWGSFETALWWQRHALGNGSHAPKPQIAAFFGRVKRGVTPPQL
jgi:hypothetical protein